MTPGRHPDASAGTGSDRAADPPDVPGAGTDPLDGVCAVVLAAGEGRRLRPLTELLPKALCPVGNVPLLDRALGRVESLGLVGPDTVAVNACYLGDEVVRHVGMRVHLSVEPGSPLGTAGGLAGLRDWIDGRAVLVGNADGYLADPDRPPGPDIAALFAGWDGRTVRLLSQPVTDPDDQGEFSGRRFTGFSLLPWRYVRDLLPVESNLVREVWRPAEAAGELELVPFSGTYLDTGTPADYLAANLHAAAGGNLIDPTATVTGSCAGAVVGAGAIVHGSVLDGVVWPGELVAEGERLSSAVRFGRGRTLPGTRL